MNTIQITDYPAFQTCEKEGIITFLKSKNIPYILKTRKDNKYETLIINNLELQKLTKGISLDKGKHYYYYIKEADNTTTIIELITYFAWQGNYEPWSTSYYPEIISATKEKKHERYFSLLKNDIKSINEFNSNLNEILECKTRYQSKKYENFEEYLNKQQHYLLKKTLKIFESEMIESPNWTEHEVIYGETIFTKKINKLQKEINKKLLHKKSLSVSDLNKIFGFKKFLVKDINL
jgi:hypothetical protein